MLRAVSAARDQPVPAVKDGTENRMTLKTPAGATTSFSYVWLRDHCREERSYHPKTKQRLVDTYLIPENIKPASLRIENEGLYITWPESPFESSYESFYPWSFLVEHSYEPPLMQKRDRTQVRTRKMLWSKKIQHSLPRIPYEEVMGSEEGVYDWLRQIDNYGFSFVHGIPHTPEATEELIKRIAFIRETHYGGFWDFTANLEHGDLAYSEVKLEAHTDTTYFTDPCGLQLFHLLSPTSTHTGGHNLLVDGFAAAQLLRSRHPKSYELLSTLPIPAHASGSGSASLPSGVHIRPLKRYPVFNHDERGELVQVRWNADDRGVVGGLTFMGKNVDRWYKALRQWERIIRSKQAQLWTQMEPGTAVIFDNHRVLHGRSAFSGTRRLCGAYVSGDDYRSRLLGLEKQFGARSGRGMGPWRLERKGVKEAMNRNGIERKGGAPMEEGRREAWREYLW
ncbi:hypothetical protein JCM8547_000750 [Rhodosporidiobolus lusitaniae]